MSRVQTENSHFESKVALRQLLLPQKGHIKVIDAFSADGKIWEEIKSRCPETKIDVLRIEKRNGRKRIYLKGNNVKFLKAIPLMEFDVIDLDAYGVPFDQLKVLFEKNYKGVVFVTFIQSVMGALPKKFMEELGFTEEMLAKCKTIFSADRLSKFKQWLANYGVKKIEIISFGKKHYLGFCTD